MNQVDMQQKLIDSTISVIANVGIHKATTKLIAAQAGLNEVYIYRLFNDKDHLLEAAFTSLDHEFAAAIIAAIPIMDNKETDIEERCWIYFLNGWKFLLSNKEKCSFFIKYYHSQCFDAYSVSLRKQTYKKVIDRFTSAFKENTDVWMLFNHILDIVFSGVIKVLRDESLNNIDNIQMIYGLLYSSIKSYLSWTDETNVKKHTIAG